MEFLNNLFWLPINSMGLIINLGLWALLIYIIYEAFRYWRNLQLGVNYLGQGTGVRTYEELTLFILFMDRPEHHPRQIIWRTL